MQVDQTTPLSQLLQAIRDPDARNDAMAEIQRRLSPLASSAYRRFRPPNVTVDEIVAEALADIHVNVERFAAADNPDAYVRRLVYNAAARLLRRERRFLHASGISTDDLPANALTDPSGEGSFRDSAPQQQLHAVLEAALSRLRPRDRQLLRAKFAGESIEDLSRRHGISYSTMAVRLHRSSQRLAKELGISPEPAAQHEFHISLAAWIRHSAAQLTEDK